MVMYKPLRSWSGQYGVRWGGLLITILSYPSIKTYSSAIFIFLSQTHCCCSSKGMSRLLSVGLLTNTIKKSCPYSSAKADPKLTRVKSQYPDPTPAIIESSAKSSTPPALPALVPLHPITQVRFSMSNQAAALTRDEEGIS